MNILDFIFGRFPKGITKEDMENLSRRQHTPRWLTKLILRGLGREVEDAIKKVVEEQERFDKLHKASHRRVKDECL